MSAEATIYDFERILSAAAAQVFTNAGLIASTPYSDPKFQKVRPRVEVIFKAAGEASPKREAIMIDGTRRAAAFKGELSIHAITDPSPTGKNTHGEYRAFVRSICATLGYTINGTLLPYHKVEWIVETNTSHGIRTQDGFEQSTITFSVDFAVQADAWTGDFTVPVLNDSSVPTWWVMDWIAQTYNLATSGTNAVIGDQALAQAAYDLAETGTNAANQSYSLALQAMQAVWNGTDASNFPSWVMDWLWQTYTLATSGTVAANSADRWARDAYSLAVVGTIAAAAAQTTANDAQAAAAHANETAQDAYSLAVAGTNAAHEADSWARDAYGIAVNGTNAANQTWTLAGEAYTLAQVGTNAAAAAQGGVNATDVTARVALNLAATGTNAANEADSWARDAFGMAVNGTNAANAANSYAGQAWTIAVAGTTAAATAQTGVNETSLIARDAWSLAIAGTNAAHEADSWARDAYGLAVTGTNAAAAAQATATSAQTTGGNAYNLALSALAYAWSGTNLSWWSQDIFQNYDTSPVLPISSPLTNTQIAYGTNWVIPATFNGTSAPDAQSGYSGTSCGWPNDSFEQYNTGTIITAVTISQGTGWTGPAYIY